MSAEYANKVKSLRRGIKGVGESRWAGVTRCLKAEAGAQIGWGRWHASLRGWCGCAPRFFAPRRGSQAGA